MGPVGREGTWGSRKAAEAHFRQLNQGQDSTQVEKKKRQQDCWHTERWVRTRSRRCGSQAKAGGIFRAATRTNPMAVVKRNMRVLNEVVRKNSPKGPNALDECGSIVQ